MKSRRNKKDRFPSDKLVPLPSPDTSQRVDEDNSLIIPFLHLFPVLDQVITVSQLRCYLLGVYGVNGKLAALLILKLATLVLLSNISLNVLSQPYIRHHSLKILFAVLMSVLTAAAVLTALFYPFAAATDKGLLFLSGVSILLNYSAIYLGALYYRLRG